MYLNIHVDAFIECALSVFSHSSTIFKHPNINHGTQGQKKAKQTSQDHGVYMPAIPALDSQNQKTASLVQ